MTITQEKIMFMYKIFSLHNRNSFDIIINVKKLA